jgi:CBS domain-containing protein
MANVASILKDKPAGGTVYAVDPDLPVLEAIKRMADHGVGALLVMKGDKLVGVLSERDYARKVILMGRASASTAVREIMSSPVISVTRDHSVQECMQIITDRRIRHLAVVEGEKVLGLISIGDCARSMLAEQRQLIEQLENYVRG